MKMILVSFNSAILDSLRLSGSNDFPPGLLVHCTVCLIYGCFNRFATSFDGAGIVITN